MQFHLLALVATVVSGKLSIHVVSGGFEPFTLLGIDIADKTVVYRMVQKLERALFSRIPNWNDQIFLGRGDIGKISLSSFSFKRDAGRNVMLITCLDDAAIPFAFNEAEWFGDPVFWLSQEEKIFDAQFLDEHQGDPRIRLAVSRCAHFRKLWNRINSFADGRIILERITKPFQISMGDRNLISFIDFFL